MLRRNFLIATLLLSARARGAWPGSQSEFDLYRNAAVPLEGTVDDRWAWPGNALTASVVVIHGSAAGGALEGYRPQVASASWVLVWNPNARSIPTGVRLVQADLGPKNIVEVARSVQTDASEPRGRAVPVRIVEIARSERGWYATPRVDAFDISEAIRKALLGSSKVFGHQTIGNGSNGCLIYASWIEVMWKLS